MSKLLYSNTPHKHKVWLVDRRYRSRSTYDFKVMMEFGQQESAVAWDDSLPAYHFEKYKQACWDTLGEPCFDSVGKRDTEKWMSTSKRQGYRGSTEWKFYIFLRSEKDLTLANLGLT